MSGRHSHPDRGRAAASTVVGDAGGGRASQLWRRVRGWRWKRILALGIPGVLLLMVAGFLTAYAMTDIPEPNEFTQEQSVVVRYADGSEIGRLGTNRRLVTLAEVSEPAQKAVLSAEDRGFYSEPGISPKGIARALFTNVKGGGTQQGGSTITQQYAKNAFLTQERTYTRKVKEVLISLKMTRQRSKEQILQDYLNTIYFGRGAYGIQAASQVYFGVPASRLNAAQGAVLAAVIVSPSSLDPAKAQERLRGRYQYVLDGMLENEWITQAEFDRARKGLPKVLPVRKAGSALSGPEGTLVRAVMDELKASGAITEEDIDRGGLDIRTTIDAKAQRAAVAAIQGVTGTDRTGKGLQGALVAVEPGTGQVKAYYGGANGTGIDYAGTPRQPGSSFKAYTLAAALKKGISLTTRYDGSSPKEFGGVEISNFGDASKGRQDLVEMTRDSTNTAYYALAEEVGADEIAETAYESGISRKNPLRDGEGIRSAQITLGAYEIRPLDQAAGFATFAAGGKSATPYLVQTVRMGGEIVYRGRSTKAEAFDEDVAADATFALRQVVEDGSGTRAQLDGGRPAAGKTGTTSENTNIWFAGYTKQLAAAVWFGYGTPRTITIDGVGEATGGRVASAAWSEFMDPAMEGLPEEDFPPRAGVGSDSDSPAPTSTGGGSGSSGGLDEPVETSSPAPTSTPSAAVPTTRAPTPRPTVTRPPVVTLEPDPLPPPTQPPPVEPTAEPTASAVPTVGAAGVAVRGRAPAG